MILTTSNRKSFFKLYTPRSECRPEPRIYVYYKGRPLYLPAVFENDRYVFRLPLNLLDKMMSGGLYADFNYTEMPYDDGLLKNRSMTPVSLVLSDRYL